jgi:hypothetical protein
MVGNTARPMSGSQIPQQTGGNMAYEVRRRNSDGVTGCRFSTLNARPSLPRLNPGAARDRRTYQTVCRAAAAVELRSGPADTARAHSREP